MDMLALVALRRLFARETSAAEARPSTSSRQRSMRSRAGWEATESPRLGRTTNSPAKEFRF